MLGLLRPFTTWLIGAMLVGSVAALPVFFGVMLTLQGSPARWAQSDRIIVVLLSVIFGSFLGAKQWRASASERAGASATASPP